MFQIKPNQSVQLKRGGQTYTAQVISLAGGFATVRIAGEKHSRKVRLNSINQLPNVPAPKPVQVSAPKPVTKTPVRSTTLEVAGGSVWIISHLTPQMAQSFLDNPHPGQRNIRENHMMAIAIAMESGDYRWTGDAVKFDSSGRLVDGQHRMSAVVFSGVTLPDVICVRLADDEVANYLDTTSRPRSLADVRRFNQQRLVNGAVIAAILLDHTDFNVTDRSQLSKPIQNQVVESCPQLDDLLYLYGVGRKVGLVAGQLAGVLRCLQANPTAARLFFESVFRNVHQINGVYEPMVKLAADWFFREKEQRTGAIRSKNKVVLGSEDRTSAAKVIRVYNAWRRHENLGKIQLGDTIQKALP